MQLIECSKRSFGTNNFIFYAVADGLFALLAKYKQGINHMLFNPPKTLCFSSHYLEPSLLLENGETQSEFWLTIFISGDIIFYVKGKDGEK